jgi:transcriptional regulator with XRE-family HTH domain
MKNEPSYGEWLRRKRGTKRMPGFISQQGLADKVGVLRTYINQIENGRVDVPEYPLRQRIHEALGSSEQELIDLGIVRDVSLRGTATAHIEAHAPTVQVIVRDRGTETAPTSRADDFWHSLTVDQKDKFLAWVEEKDARAHLKDEREGDEPAASG